MLQPAPPDLDSAAGAELALIVVVDQQQRAVELREVAEHRQVRLVVGRVLRPAEHDRVALEAADAVGL